MLEPVWNQRGARDHPVQSHVGEPGFVLQIAPADSGVYARKPHLFKEQIALGIAPILFLRRR